MTDVANWERVQAVGHTTTAVFLTLTGRQAFARLQSAPLVQSVQRRLLPVARNALAPVRRAVAQRPVYAVGTAAVATTYAASVGQAPAAIRDTFAIGARMAGGMQRAVRAATSLVEHVGRSASVATQQTANQAVALASGIAGLARGAGSIMAARPSKPIAAAGGVRVRASGAGPMRAMLPDLRLGVRAQQLALVASRR